MPFEQGARGAEFVEYLVVVHAAFPFACAGRK
jgi:hypothetical protein